MGEGDAVPAGKLGLLVKGLFLLLAYKLAWKRNTSFSDYLLERVKKGGKTGDARFAIRLYTVEIDVARLAEVARHIDFDGLKLAKPEWMALIESQIWEKGENVTRLIEVSGLDDAMKRSYKAVAGFYGGELKGPELAGFNPDDVHGTWLWYLKELFAVYALCESGRVDQAEKLLVDVLERDPEPFIEFQGRFERTGYWKHHIRE